MKNIFSKKLIVNLVFIVAVVVAMPVFASAKTTNWTNGALTQNFTTAGNWSNGVPATGDTVQFLDSTKLLPTLNRPNTGVFTVVLRDDVGSGWPQNLDTPHTFFSTFMGTGNWTYSSITIGGSNEHGDDIDIDKDGQAGSTITIWASSQVEMTNVVNATVTIKSGGLLYGEIPNSLSQTLIVENGGTFAVNSSGGGWIFSLNNIVPLQLAGTLTSSGSGAVTDNAGPIIATGDSNINWTGNLLVYGGLNASGYTVTHTNTTGAQLVIDQPGIMDLGTTDNNVPGLTVQTDSTIHLNKNWTMSGMTVALGTGTLIADADLTINGASATAITSTGATITGTGHTVTVSNLGNQTVDCWDCIDGGGNGVNVVFHYTDANLTGLAISSGTLSPTFASSTTAYTNSVAYSVSSVTVTPTKNQAGATIKVDGTSVTSGSPSNPIALNVGDNIITILVTAQDTTTTKTYTITVTRGVASTDANLSNLTISSGTLSPTFASGTTSYTASVDYNTNSLTITPSQNQANATIKVNGTTVVSGSASGTIPLNVGSNTITVLVTAQDTTTTKTYTITITRASASTGGNGGNIAPTIASTTAVLDKSATIIALRQQLISLLLQAIQLLQAKLLALTHLE